ncbi:MAG: hypothetical protein HKP41_22170 [Desulfobacterales bacterium]|nr:hypothetical protein [Desulfobacterales bacterium]
MQAQKLAEAEELKVELRRVDESLVSIREEYIDYVKRVDDLLDLFVNGDIRDAEQIANVTEKLEEGFNQRLERFCSRPRKLIGNHCQLLEKERERQ